MRIAIVRLTALTCVAVMLMPVSVFAQETTQPAPQIQTPAPAAPTTGQTQTGPATGTQTPTQAPTPEATGDPEAGRPAPCITLQQAVDMAVRNNPQVLTALQQIEIAGGQVSEAAARGRFNADATVAYTQQQAQTFTIADPNTGREGDVTIVPAGNLTARVAATQPIDIFGQVRLARQVASLNERVQVLTLGTTALDVALNARTAYYSVLRAYGQRDTAQAAVDVALEQLRISTAQFEAGTAARFDVTQAEVRVANLRQVLVNAQNNVRLAKAALNVVLARPANAPIEVQQQVITVDGQALNVDALVQNAWQNRTEVLAAQTAVQAAEQNVQLTRRQLYPTTALTGDVNWTRETQGFAGDNVTWTAGAVLQVPVFDGGVTRAQVRQARANVGISQAQLEQARLGVSLDVQNAVTNLRNARERVSVAQANVSLAEEGLRLAQVRYEAQVGTFVEVTEAERSLTEARVILVNANYDYLTATAQLQRALGADVASASPTTPAATPQPAGS